MITAHNIKFDLDKIMLWTGRICLLIATVSAFIYRYYHYVPNLYVVDSWAIFGQAMNQALAIAIPLIFIAGFAWIWHAPGGLIAVFGAWIGYMRVASEAKYLGYIDYLLVLPYLIFGFGGVLLLTVGLRNKRWMTHLTYCDSRAYKWMMRAAWISTFLPGILVFVTLMILGRPVAFVLIGAIYLFIAGIAFVWALPGGILVLLIGILMLEAIWYGPRPCEIFPTIYIPYFVMYIIGGILYVVASLGFKERIRSKT